MKGRATVISAVSALLLEAAAATAAPVTIANVPDWNQPLDAPPGNTGTAWGRVFRALSIHCGLP